jgi:hypothetical protein
VNLASAISIYAGGPGSGCTGPNCGRPVGLGKPVKPREWKSKTGLAGRFFRPGTVVANLYDRLAMADGKWVHIDALPKRMEGIVTLRKAGKETGRWDIERHGDMFRMNMKQDPGRQFDRKDEVRPPGGNEEDRKMEEHLLNDKIVDKERRYGGIHETYKVEFADGSFGTWKPKDKADDTSMRRNISTGKSTEREVGAWVVAKAAGMQDLVTPAVIRTYEGRRGVLLAWQVGDTAKDVNRDKRFDGNTDLARMAVFDYVIGNEDRHAGNWIVSPDGKLKAIDHGLSFPDKKPFMGQSDRHAQFLVEADERGSMDRHGMEAEPKKFARPFVSAKADILSGLKDVGLPDKAIKQVGERIDKLATATRWSQLHNIGGIWS